MKTTKLTTKMKSTHQLKQLQAYGPSIPKIGDSINIDSKTFSQRPIIQQNGFFNINTSGVSLSNVQQNGFANLNISNANLYLIKLILPSTSLKLKMLRLVVLLILCFCFHPQIQIFDFSQLFQDFLLPTLLETLYDCIPYRIKLFFSLMQQKPSHHKAEREFKANSTNHAHFILQDNTVVYASSKRHSRIITYLSFGTEIIVLDYHKERRWFLIEWTNDEQVKRGWVLGCYVFHP